MKIAFPRAAGVSPQALRARVRARYSQLDPRDVVCLVAWHQEKQVRCGYLILQLAQTDAVTGEAQSAIYDLAVEPRFQGTAAVGACIVGRPPRLPPNTGWRGCRGISPLPT